jgi:hypothetical protein
MKKIKFLYPIFTIILIAFICANYSLIHYMNKNDLKLQAYGTLPYLKFTQKYNGSNLIQTSAITKLSRVAEDTKFVFKNKYKDKEVKNMVLEKYFNGSTALNNKTRSELNDFFKNQGYVVSNMSSAEVIFVNESDRYSYKANRFFLGVYEGNVTIYKTDKNADISSQKVFNSNVYDANGKQLKYNFESEDKGELQYIKIDDLKEKDGLVDDLIRGRKYNKDNVSTKVAQDMEANEYEKGEFKTAEKAFDYAMGLLKS